MKPLFTDKILANVNIVLVENREIINESYKIAEIFKCLFSNAVKDLGIEIIGQHVQILIFHLRLLKKTLIYSP